MMKRYSKAMASGLIVTGAMALAVAGCSSFASDDPASLSGGGGGAGESSSTGAPVAGAAGAARHEGRVSFRLVDAPADVQSIFVTVSRLDAEIEGGWRTLVEREETIDLLTLRDGAYFDLGSATLPPGRVGQLRLHLAEGGAAHVTTKDGVEHPLTIPSGAQSGIKLVGGFDVPECATGQITIDFDGERSLELDTVGANGKGKPGDAGDDAEGFKLRPVVRIKALVMKSDCASLDADAGADADAPLDAALVDPCADVTCSESEVCDNGVCRAAE